MGFESLILPALTSLASGVSSMAAPIMSGVSGMGSMLGSGLAGLGSGVGSMLGMGSAAGTGSGALGALGNLAGAGQIAPAVTWGMASPAQFAEAAGLASLSPTNAISSMTMAQGPNMGQQLMKYAGGRLIDNAFTPRPRSPAAPIMVPQGGDLSAPVVNFSQGNQPINPEVLNWGGSTRYRY